MVVSLSIPSRGRRYKFLFEQFVNSYRDKTASLELLSPKHYNVRKMKKILLIGSGGLSIGQAGEFDYSDSW